MCIRDRLSTIGSLYWDGYSPSKMILSDIPSSNQIKLGDTIVTGGMSFYFPKGIPIGTISNYETNLTEGYFDIEVSIFNIKSFFKFLREYQNRILEL